METISGVEQENAKNGRKRSLQVLYPNIYNAYKAYHTTQSIVLNPEQDTAMEWYDKYFSVEIVCQFAYALRL